MYLCIHQDIHMLEKKIDEHGRIWVRAFET